jgi:hypothetical protein
MNDRDRREPIADFEGLRRAALANQAPHAGSSMPVRQENGFEPDGDSFLRAITSNPTGGEVVPTSSPEIAAMVGQLEASLQPRSISILRRGIDAQFNKTAGDLRRIAAACRARADALDQTADKLADGAKNVPAMLTEWIEFHQRAMMQGQAAVLASEEMKNEQ